MKEIELFVKGVCTLIFILSVFSFAFLALFSARYIYTILNHRAKGLVHILILTILTGVFYALYSAATR